MYVCVQEFPHNIHGPPFTTMNVQQPHEGEM